MEENIVTKFDNALRSPDQFYFPFPRGSVSAFHLYRDHINCVPAKAQGYVKLVYCHWKQLSGQLISHLPCTLRRSPLPLSVA